MTGILVALKTILEIDAVAGALGALDAGLNVAGLFKILKSKFKRDSIEYQMLCVLDESLKEACNKLEWEYNALAVAQATDLSTFFSNRAMTKDMLGELFAILVGAEIDDSALDVIVECFDLHVAKKPELHRYLDQKWKRYNEEGNASITQPSSAEFSAYYDFIETEFTEKKEEDPSNIVGSESDEEAYIDQFINSVSGPKLALTFLSDWFQEKRFGTMLICGEPGQGKSLLCKKAVVDFKREHFLNGSAQNVLAISLNTGENPRIVQNGMVCFENMLAWGPIREHGFTFENCRGSLLFMDGFDEFIDEARKADVKDIVTFMNIVDGIAKAYNMHIVILSRSIAVLNEIHDSEIRNKSFTLSLITKEQQTNWMKARSDYSDYEKTLEKLQADKKTSELLGIPLLFRMIVHTQFDKVSSNRVELYDDLFNHLMRKRRIYGAALESVRKKLSAHAYDVYCNDEDTAEAKLREGDKNWYFTFYITQTGKSKIGFYHRSFYQYLLAKYIFSHLLGVITDNQAEEFIGLFAERELDVTVRQYLSLMINDENRESIHNNIKLIVDALVRTEAYLNLEPRYPFGNAEKTKIGRTINVYRNTLNICTACSYVIEIPFREGLDVFIRLFPSNGIGISSYESSRADLSFADLRGADLRGADLSRANLSGADLSRADLSRAYLRGANLSGAHLRGANLIEANLSGADLIGAHLIEANLRGAHLRGAHLIEANLSGAHLRGADLSGANLSRADLSFAYLIGADLSGAYLIGANLSLADLSRANLSGADLSGADLSGAHLSRADLSRAYLSLANLSGAYLIGANIDDADLRVKYINYTRIDSGKKALIDPSIEGYETIVWIDETDNND